MSQTQSQGPRHARFDELDPPTTAIPVVPTAVPDKVHDEVPAAVSDEFTDDATQAIPVIPRQRTESPVAHAPTPQVFPVREQPAGVHPVESVPSAPRRRVLPAVLAGVTACLLVAGIAVGVTGATSADLTGPTSSTSGTP